MSGNGERRNKISTTNEHIRERDDDDYDDDRISDYDDRCDKRVVLDENSKILIRKARGELWKCDGEKSAVWNLCGTKVETVAIIWHILSRILFLKKYFFIDRFDNWLIFILW